MQAVRNNDPLSQVAAWTEILRRYTSHDQPIASDDRAKLVGCPVRLRLDRGFSGDAEMRYRRAIISNETSQYGPHLLVLWGYSGPTHDGRASVLPDVIEVDEDRARKMGRT